MPAVLNVGSDLGHKGLQVVVYQFRYFLRGATTSTADRSDRCGVLVYLFEEIHLMSARGLVVNLDSL